MLNSRGITAIVDASLFILLVGIAATFVAVTLETSGDGADVQDPSVLLDRLMASKITYEDVGMEGGLEKAVPMYRIAYTSINADDGCFAGYLERILGEVYPWEGAYLCTVECGDHSVSIGRAGTGEWMGCTKTYQTGRGTDIVVNLMLYR